MLLEQKLKIGTKQSEVVNIGAVIKLHTYYNYDPKSLAVCNLHINTQLGGSSTLCEIYLA